MQLNRAPGPQRRRARPPPSNRCGHFERHPRRGRHMARGNRIVEDVLIMSWEREGGREIRHHRFGVDRNLNRLRRRTQEERVSTINYLSPDRPEVEPVLSIA